MAITYDPIFTQTLGSSASSITFSSIPATFTDLRFVITGHATGTNGEIMRIQFNSDTGSNYSATELRATGSSVSSNRFSNTTSMRIAFMADDFLGATIISTASVDIFSYTGSTNKTALGTGSVDANGSGYVTRSVGLWRNTSAITSITILPASGDVWTAGTTATLYGIKNA
jgi:hypothetical protein